MSLDPIVAALIFGFNDSGGGGESSTVVISSESSRTIEGYSVPNMTEDQIISAYNALATGKPCILTDSSDSMHFMLDQADSLSNVISVQFVYFDKLLITYSVENDDVYETHFAIGPDAAGTKVKIGGITQSEYNATNISNTFVVDITTDGTGTYDYTTMKKALKAIYESTKTCNVVLKDGSDYLPALYKISGTQIDVFAAKYMPDTRQYLGRHISYVHNSAANPTISSYSGIDSDAVKYGNMTVKDMLDTLDEELPDEYTEAEITTLWNEVMA